MHENELAHWFDDGAMAKVDERSAKLYFLAGREQVAPYKSRTRLFREGEVFPGVTAVPSLGHTPGHTAYLIASGNDQLMIWGDTVHVPEVQTAFPEAGMAFDTDLAAAAAARKRMFDRVSADGILDCRDAPAFPGVLAAGPARRRLRALSRGLGPHAIAELELAPRLPAQRASRASAPPASARVSSAAGISRPIRTACPAQRLVKSTLPSFSAAAFSGPSAVAACGNAGASGEIGPTSRMTRLATPRAGRPVMTLVMTVESSLRLGQRGARRRDHLGFRAAQIGAADLHAGRAERKRRRDAAPVGDAAGRDHRHLHRIDHLRHQRKRAGLLGDIVGQEHAAMAAGLRALRDDDVGAVLLQPDRFLHDGRRRHHDGAGRLDALDQRRIRQAEMEADHFRLQLLDERAHRFIERRAVGGVDRRRGIEPELLVIRRQAAPSIRLRARDRHRPACGRRSSG